MAIPPPPLPPKNHRKKSFLAESTASGSTSIKRVVEVLMGAGDLAILNGCWTNPVATANIEVSTNSVEVWRCMLLVVISLYDCIRITTWVLLQYDGMKIWGKNDEKIQMVDGRLQVFCLLACDLLAFACRRRSACFNNNFNNIGTEIFLPSFQ